MKQLICLFFGHTPSAGNLPLQSIEFKFATYDLEMCGRCKVIYCLRIRQKQREE